MKPFIHINHFPASYGCICAVWSVMGKRENQTFILSTAMILEILPRCIRALPMRMVSSSVPLMVTAMPHISNTHLDHHYFHVFHARLALCPLLDYLHTCARASSSFFL